MVTTLCLNPSFDRTVTVPRLRVGGTNRISAARTDAGGKGVNVLRTLVSLGCEARCVLVCGEDGGGRFLDMLRREGLDSACSAVTVPGTLRTNTKVLSLADQPLTELNEPGPCLGEEGAARVLSLLREETRPGDLLVLTGSLPPKAPGELYTQIMQALPERRCVLDVGGAPLMDGLRGRPWLIKPNRDELEAAVGRELKDREDILRAAEELRTLGAERALVSLGGDGAVLLSPEGAWYAPAVRVEVRSTVGAGDTMLGGLLSACERGLGLREAFRWSVAAATASVTKAGTERVSRGEAEALLPRVTVEDL